jgi:hypothetical protein
MLLIMQLLMRRVSFLGHLSGMIVGYAYYFGMLKFVVPAQTFFAECERKICCFRQRFGYVSAEGQVVGQYRPWTVFQHSWARDDEEQVLQRVGNGESPFRGTGRTIGGGDQTPQGGGGGEV